MSAYKRSTNTCLAYINTGELRVTGKHVQQPVFIACTVYPKKYAHGFVVLCFVVVMQSFLMNSYEVFIHIHQGCFAGTGAIVRLPQCQWSKPDGYGKINQCITTTKHSKAKTVCIFLGIYCNWTKSMTQHRYACCCIDNTSWAPVRKGINSIEFVFLYWSCDVRGLLNRSKLGTNQYIRIQLQKVLWFVPLYQNIQLIYLWRYTERERREHTVAKHRVK